MSNHIIILYLIHMSFFFLKIESNHTHCYKNDFQQCCWSNDGFEKIIIVQNTDFNDDFINNWNFLMIIFEKSSCPSFSFSHKHRPSPSHSHHNHKQKKKKNSTAYYAHPTLPKTNSTTTLTALKKPHTWLTNVCVETLSLVGVWMMTSSSFAPKKPQLHLKTIIKERHFMTD